uniref:Uncharacterized protein n=1 Tax=Arundo donax TaxID=35708 RepID=A0A0A8XT12_ARUDO
MEMKKRLLPSPSPNFTWLCVSTANSTSSTARASVSPSPIPAPTPPPSSYSPPPPTTAPSVGSTADRSICSDPRPILGFFASWALPPSPWARVRGARVVEVVVVMVWKASLTAAATPIA